jgi:ribonuclease VapC
MGSTLDLFAGALASAPSVVVGAPTWVEASMVVTARLGKPGYKEFLALMQVVQADMVSWNEELALATYDAWLRCGRRRHPARLNFGDCFSYALASQRQEPLLFKGDDFSMTDVTSAV